MRSSWESCCTFSLVGRRKQMHFKCFIVSRAEASILSNKYTSFCKISDWANTMLTIGVWRKKLKKMFQYLPSAKLYCGRKSNMKN